MKFTISETNETLVSHSGLALAGALLQKTSSEQKGTFYFGGAKEQAVESRGGAVG